MFSRRLVSAPVLTTLKSASSASYRFTSTASRVATRTPAATRTFSTTKSRRYALPGAPEPTPNKLPVIPLIAIFLAGSGLFAYMVKDQEEKKMPVVKTGTGSHNTTFDPEKVTVVYVLGGPGAGKGTQCENLVRDYKFVHLSAGDLLRAEQERPGSEFGELIKTYIKEGKIVPMEVTVALLQNAMKAALDAGRPPRFLIDGFPRQVDQARKFEDEVCPCKFTLFFDCPEAVLEKRLLKRGETSGRSDDNIESIKKRFRTFIETSLPVIDMFEKEGKVVKVYSGGPVDGVYTNVREVMKLKLGL